MIRIDRVHYRLLWRRKLGRDFAYIDSFVTPYHFPQRCSIDRTKYLSRNLQQLRRYQATKSAWSLSMRSSSLSESLPSYVDDTRRRESSRLDTVPNDLSEVVNKVLTFIELNHEDTNIREKFIRNFESARRRPFDDIDHYIPENINATGTNASRHGVNGHAVKQNGHHLSFDEMISDLSVSNNNFRLDNGYEDNLSAVNGLNGLNGSYHGSTAIVGLGDYSKNANDDQEKHHEKLDATDLSPFDSIRAKYRHEYVAKNVNGVRTKDFGEIAIYHALKNDHQSGGHIEEVKTLTSKLDPVPFANVEALLTRQANNERKNDAVRPQHDHVESLDSECVMGDVKQHDLTLSSEANHSNLFEELESTTDFHLNGKLSLQESYGENQLHANCKSLTSPVENGDSLSLNGLHNDVTHGIKGVNGYDCNHGHVNGYHHSTSPSLNGHAMDPATCNFDLDGEVGTDSLHKSVSDSLFVSKPLGTEELASWFQSDFLENGTGFDGETFYNQVPEAEQARTEALFEAVILLRTLTEDHWNCFDLGDTRSLRLSEESMESTFNDSESIPFDNRRTVDILSDMFSHDMISTDEHLTTADYNFSLARIAVATDVAPDDILALLMQTHKQMNELYLAGFTDSRPNSITHEILLLALVRRFSAFHNAIDLVTSLSKSPHFSWTPNSLLVASELCKRKDHLKMARDIMNDLLKWNTSPFVIPRRVFNNLITVYKDNDARKDAIEMLRLGLKQASGKSDRHLDEIFVNTIKWPTMSRLSGFIDNSSVIADILLLLENETLYVAGLPVWKELIKRSALGAARIPSRWEFVAKSFHYLSVAAPYYCPDHLLLQNGLEASGALVKPSLACDLLRRAIVHYTPSPLLVIENPLLRRPHVPYQHFVNGISTCVKANDMKACEKILHIAKSVTMNPSNIRSLYILALKGYANTGDVDKTVKILETMIAEKLMPGEDCYGALFYAFGMSSHVDAARELLQDMESGVIGVSPGPTCYDGFILACARNGAWDDVLAAFETMKILNVSISSASSHGIVLAAAKIGGRSEVQRYVESFVSLNAELYGDGALLALRILLEGVLLPSEVETEEWSLDGIRERLRVLSQHDPSLQSECLRLIRSIRMAESEEARCNEDDTVKNQKFLPHSDQSDRRHYAWQTMLKDLLALVSSTEHHTETIKGCDSESSSSTPMNDDLIDEQLCCK